MADVPSSTPVPASRCLRCGDQVDRAFSARLDAARPHSGDATICASCSHVMIFADDLTLRNPDAEEQRSLDRDPYVQWVRELHRDFLQQRTKH